MPDPTAKQKAEAIATELKHRFKAKKPDFTPKWSREWVIPDNVLAPADAAAELQVDSKYPENRPSADITVIQAWDKGSVPGVKIPLVQLKQKKVVKADGTRPSLKFTLDNNIWDKFDQLQYHFNARIDQTTKPTTKPLKVKRWHVQAVDIGDTRPDFPPMRASEKANFLNAFAGSADDRAQAWEFDAGNTTLAVYGGKMKNTYSFVYTGHGAVMCRTCQSMWIFRYGQPQEPAEITAGLPAPTNNEADYGQWTTCSTDGCTGAPRSTHCIGGWKTAPAPSFMDGTHVADDGICPTTPKYLMFSICCGGAFETSLYDAYIGRGTKYCVGFKKSTRCDWARDYARSFFDTWVKTHKCDPEKIPDVFDGLQATWQVKLQPDLFGRVWGVGSRLRNLGRQIADLF
jgi:hypothetical protein